MLFAKYLNLYGIKKRESNHYEATMVRKIIISNNKYSINK